MPNDMHVRDVFDVDITVPKPVAEWDMRTTAGGYAQKPLRNGPGLVSRTVFRDSQGCWFFTVETRSG